MVLSAAGKPLHSRGAWKKTTDSGTWVSIASCAIRRESLSFLSPSPLHPPVSQPCAGSEYSRNPRLLIRKITDHLKRFVVVTGPLTSSFYYILATQLISEFYMIAFTQLSPPQGLPGIVLPSTGWLVFRRIQSSPSCSPIHPKAYSGRLEVT